VATPEPTIELKFSGRYDWNRLERLIETLMPILELERPAVIHFDFAGLVGVNPAALALVTAVVKDAVMRNVLESGSVISEARSSLVWNYMLRMDFLKILFGEAGYSEESEEPFTRKKDVGFRPCSEFTSPTEARPVAKGLSEALTESMVADEISTISLDIALSELTDNVLHHADARAGGFAAAQHWRKKGQFEIAIVDLGIGILSSLQKNPAYADIPDDVTAIQTALRPHVTSTPERNSGIGLFVTRLLLRENGGSFLVRSGKGAVYSGVEEGTETRGVAFPGTLVALRANTDRPLDINRVYAMLPNDDVDSGDDDD
jgi:anti-sigma regulatory factor (Ser/Thr protein kinase)